MNLNFCRYKCGKSWHPDRIVRRDDGTFVLLMQNDGSSWNCNDATCRYVEIEDASDFMRHPPDGWMKNDRVGEVVLYSGNAEDSMWRIRLKGYCPYVAEHLLYDIQHEKRLEEWRRKESDRMALLADRIERHKRLKEKHADGEGA